MVLVSTAAKSSARVGEGLGTFMGIRSIQSNDNCINFCNVIRIIFNASGFKPIKPGRD